MEIDLSTKEVIEILQNHLSKNYTKESVVFDHWRSYLDPEGVIFTVKQK